MKKEAISFLPEEDVMELTNKMAEAGTKLHLGLDKCITIVFKSH